MGQSSKPLVIVIAGPTASGKTAVAIELAKKLKADIFSADSRQFYQEMCIGTAVPSPEELNAANHHFIQHRSIQDAYSVYDYQTDIIEKLEVYFKKNSIAILAGGSGLFIDACIKGLHDLPEKDQKLRASIEETLARKGISALQQQLKHLDAEHYQTIDINNPHRLIRAIEICLTTGKSISELRSQSLPTRNFSTQYFVLSLEREKLYQRINNRVDKMLEMGLIDEAKKLYPYRNLQAVNTVGYKELFAYFENRISLTEAIELIKQNTRRYAKRQITWFNKKDASFIPIAETSAATAAKILAQIN